MTLATVDYGDVQGLVRYGYAHMTESRFLLLRVKDPVVGHLGAVKAPKLIDEIAPLMVR